MGTAAFQTGKTTHVRGEINNELDILGVCEARQTGSGKHYLFNDKTSTQEGKKTNILKVL